MGNSMRSTPAPPERPLPSSEELDSDFLAVLSDYPSPDISPPIFRRGEKLRVISDEGGWWKAISLSTGRESYIPGICVARVYHGWLFEGLGRDKAEELLQLPDTKIGSFMIRESETKKEVADGLCCVLTTPCLTQTAAAPAVRASDSPITLRQKTFDWRRAISRQQEDSEGAESPVAVDESLFSYGLRESIASYLSLTGDDSASFDRKKKSASLMYSGSKRKSSFFSSPPYFED
ncbi:src-like-adapter isoform X5 [Bubalus bubalis]|uniref:src-like-adapter isoform X5 n=1 Tax=Bubalus bubalis TaxID=89462 RepID=UPI000DBC67DC|nr:src-like-adapter isoform X5 [Bubalus bubalis]XP_025121346.1 src-like-adapter isoform X5 [Bubalus bubalis]XP_044784794.1 src-like-adapter isoform X5 [Bubalus bubalis]